LSLISVQSEMTRIDTLAQNWYLLQNRGETVKTQLMCIMYSKI
jgi:hypothetical protein